MGEPLSPDGMFDFPIDEPEPHPAYDFFTPGPLPGYTGNPNNNNGWIEADVPLPGELGVVADKPMVGPIGDEIAEPIVEAKEQMIAPVVDMTNRLNHPSTTLNDLHDVQDLVRLGKSQRFVHIHAYAAVNQGKETQMSINHCVFARYFRGGGLGGEGGVADGSHHITSDANGAATERLSTVAAEGPSFPHPALGLRVPPSLIEDLSTRLGNLEYGHRQLVKKVIQVSDAEVAAGVFIREIGPRVFAIEGQVQLMLSQMVHVAGRFELIGTQALQAAMQQRDTQIQQLQTTVSEMSIRESILM
ncbi:hypothetical protein Tco_0765498 [Tanacetum coccineum]